MGETHFDVPAPFCRFYTKRGEQDFAGTQGEGGASIRRGESREYLIHPKVESNKQNEVFLCIHKRTERIVVR